MPKSLGSPLIAAMLFLASVTGQRVPDLRAQEPSPCEPNDTLEDCWNKILTGLPGVQAEIKSELQAKPTGPDVPDATGGSSIRDFLPRIAAALLNPGLTSDRQALSLKTNVHLDEYGLVDLGGPAAQLAVTVNEPKLFPALIDSISEGRREDARTRLQRSLDDLDDFTIGFSLNVISEKHGRNFRPHAAEISQLFSLILERAGDQPLLIGSAVAIMDSAATRINPALETDAACRPTGPDGVSIAVDEILIRCIDAGYLERVYSKFSELAERSAAAEAQRSQLLKYWGFDQIADLLNNQPQVNGGIEYRSRDDIAGPSEWMATVRREWGFSNLNRLRTYCNRLSRAQGQVSQRQQTAAFSPECLYSYLRDRRPSQGERAWMSISAGLRPSYKITLPDDTVALNLPRKWNVAPAAGYGRYLWINDAGKQQGRFDASVKGEIGIEDEVRQDRVVLSLNYTQRVTDQMSGIIGLIWANKPEFVGEVTRKARANIGLTYKLAPPMNP